MDTHVHFLDCERFHYPWLEDPEFAHLRRGYSLVDWLTDAEDVEVTAAVHVQAEVDHIVDPVEETAWLASLIDEAPAGAPPIVLVVYADLRDPGLDVALSRHREYDAVRGVRQEAWFDPSSTRADIPTENLLADEAWRAGLARLSELELSFDLLVWPDQLEEAATIFARLPDLTVIVEHTGLPPAGEQRELRRWRDSLRAFADQVPQSILKISAMAFISSTWTVDAIRPILVDAMDVFGPDRCMFGSNFPVDRSASGYVGLWSAYDAIAAGFTPAERAALFSGTAVRTYRID